MLKAVAAVLVVVLLAGCSPKAVDESSWNGNTVEFDVTAKMFEFVPSELAVSTGDKVIINAKSIDVTHGFAILDYGVNEMLNPGDSVRIEFIAGKPGNFTFFCSVPCGSGHNTMQGKLIVK